MIIVNGKGIEDEKIYLDRGFNFGYGVFETILVKEKPIFLTDHLDRLNRGLKKLKINHIIDEEYVLENIKKLQCKDCAVKLIVTDNNVIFSKRNITYKKTDYDNGFSVKISKIKRNPNSHAVYMKTLNYMDNLIERQKVLEHGYNEVLFLNFEGYLTEGSISNLFFIKNNTLYTPSINCGLLDGIVRKWIVDNYKVIEGEFNLKDLLASDGAFLTNSLMGIMKVKSIEDTIFQQNNYLEVIHNDYTNLINILC